MNKIAMYMVSNNTLMKGEGIHFSSSLYSISVFKSRSRKDCLVIKNDIEKDMEAYQDYGE